MDEKLSTSRRSFITAGAVAAAAVAAPSMRYGLTSVVAEYPVVAPAKADTRESGFLIFKQEIWPDY